ncbi:MAG: ABC transporter substrate-binding protein [Novosphingobium sp.]|nr:ABC transporter substrate-binding protein [Novosphingobium sp.]
MQTRRDVLSGLGAVGVTLTTQPVRASTEIVDALGRRVVLSAPPRRIIPIFASNTELVVAAGLTDRIVGVEAYTRFPPEIAGLPQIGGRLGFSVDRVVMLRPDLVIVTPARQAVHQLVDPLERLGIPVIVLAHPTIAAVLANLRLVARAGGVEADGDSVARRLEERLATVAARNASRPRPRALMITGRVSNGLLLVARPDTYTADAARAAGTRDALTGPRHLLQVSPEAVLRADPDCVLFAGTEAAMHEVFDTPAWSGLRARQGGRLIAVNRAEFLIPGPRVVDGIEKLATRLGAITWERPS